MHIKKHRRVTRPCQCRPCRANRRRFIKKRRPPRQDVFSEDPTAAPTCGCILIVAIVCIALALYGQSYTSQVRSIYGRAHSTATARPITLDPIQQWVHTRTAPLPPERNHNGIATPDRHRN